jgi:nucleoredoxin
MSSFFSFTSLFGNELTQHSTGKSTVSSTDSLLNGKIVGVYFSAHWCPPCQGFTPELVKFYNDLKSKGVDFEIVFVSSDKDDESFTSYSSSMPWYSLPFSERSLKNKLSSNFSVNGIPSLVWLDSDGSVITKEGRSKVSISLNDNTIMGQFPWRPLPLADEIGTSFISSDLSVKTISEDVQYLGVYFSAHW